MAGVSRVASTWEEAIVGGCLARGAPDLGTWKGAGVRDFTGWGEVEGIRRSRGRGNGARWRVG